MGKVGSGCQEIWSEHRVGGDRMVSGFSDSWGSVGGAFLLSLITF